MKLFKRQSANQVSKPEWHERETALVWGTPMVLFPALAFIPVSVSMILQPAFAHARILGCVILPLLAVAIALGVAKLAVCFRRDFDVLSLFAGGTIIAFVVISMCAGVILASAIS